MKQVAIALLMIIEASSAMAQKADPEIAKYLSMIQNGQIERVKAEIPALLEKFPNDPGVLYLQAQTTTEGAEAVRIYQSIVDNFPASEWAPESLFRVYQFYYALGLYRTAEMKMTQLKKNYPTSKHAADVSQADTRFVPEEKPPQPTGENRTPLEAHEPSPSMFTLQVGAYSTQLNADKQKAFFEGHGYPVETINRVKDSRSLFLVLVGSYKSEEEARAKSEEIKRQFNVESIVTTK